MASEELIRINKKLEGLNTALAPYKFAAVTEKEVVLLERNARYMTKEQLGRLTQNIKTDGFLTQLPLGMKRKSDGRYVILSGNHRCKASFKAGLPHIIIQYIDEVDKEKALALQLSHNSIVGQDDLSILKELYMEIESLENKEFSGVDEKALMAYDSLELPAIGEGSFTLNKVEFVFSDGQVKDYLKLEEELQKMKENIDEPGFLRFIGIPFKSFVQVISDIKDVENVKNNTVAFLRMMQICQEYVENKAEEVQEGS